MSAPRHQDDVAPASRGEARETALIALAAAAWFTLLSARPLLGSELRYAEAAREMVELRDWVVPHLAYVPYAEKPILIYWLGALGQLLAGGSAVAARLPAIVGGVVLVLATRALGRAVGGRRSGLVAAGLATISAFGLTGAVLTTDIVFTACLATAWWAFIRHLRGDGARWLGAAWMALGLATLVKGPLALVLSGGGVVTYSLATARSVEMRRCRPVLGLAIVTALNAPWAWLVWQRDPRLLQFFYVRENLQAFVDPTVNHGAGPLSSLWYYPGVLIAMFVPWSLPVLGGAVASLISVARAALARRRPAARWAADAAAVSDDDRRPARAFLASVTLFGLAFLGVSASKLPLYALPLCPALAALGADGLERWSATPWLRRLAVIQDRILAVALVGGAAAIAALLLGTRVLQDAGCRTGHVIGVAVEAALLAAMLAMARYAMGRGPDRWLPTLIPRSLMWAVAVGGMLLIGSRAQRDPDARRLAALVAARGGAEDLVVVQTKCVQDFTIVGTLRRRLHYLGDVRELGMGHAIECTSRATPIPPRPYDVNAANLPTNDWLMTERAVVDAWAGPRRCWLFARPKQFDVLRDAGMTVVVVGTADDAALATNRPLD